MRRLAPLVVVLLALLCVGGAAADWGTGDPHWSVYLNGVNGNGINCGSHSTLDNLHDSVMTVEAWVRVDRTTAGSTQRIIGKGDSAAWALYLYEDDFYFSIWTSGSASHVIKNNQIVDGSWIHLVAFFDDGAGADRKAYGAINGTWATAGGLATGTVGDDSSYSLITGERTSPGQPLMGGVAWVRISSNDRYSHGVGFTPPTSCPSDDANTVVLLCMNQGTGSTATNTGGPAPQSDRNGTITSGTWEWFDSQEIRDQLVAWWEMNENVGVRYDAHADQDLTDNNTTPRTTGKVSYAADFTAANLEYLSREDGSTLSTGDISYTVGAWVYMDVVTDSTIIGKGDEYALRYNDASGDKFEFLTGNGIVTDTVAAATPSPASTGTWYWLMGYHDRDAARIGIYRNTRLNDDTYTSGGHDGDQALYVARRGDLYLDGRVDAAVFLKNWTPNHDENAWFYNGGSGRAYSDLPMPTPTPSPTPTPTPTPSPTPITAQPYLVSLPSGGTGVITASVSAGEAMIVVSCLLLLFVLLYRAIGEKVRLWWTTR